MINYTLFNVVQQHIRHEQLEYRYDCKLWPMTEKYTLTWSSCSENNIQ